MNNLSKLIDRSGLKKTFIAKRVGVTKQTISNWVMGRYSPNIIEAQKLKEILGLDSIDELVDDKSGHRV